MNSNNANSIIIPDTEQLALLPEDERNLSQFYKSDGVAAFSTRGGKLTATTQKCMNAVIISLQTHALERFDSVEQFNEAIGENVYELKVPFSRFVDYIGYDRSNKSKAVQVIDKLKELQVDWNILEAWDESGKQIQDERIGFINLISEAEINKSKDEISISIVPKVRRELLNQETINVFDMRICNHLWSDKYTPRFYDICRVYMRKGYANFEWTVVQFRELMNVSYTEKAGVKVWGYPQFKDLKRKVLQPAVDNINESNLIPFRIECETPGNPVKIIKFKITRKEKLLTQQDVVAADVELKLEVIKLIELYRFNSVVISYFGYQTNELMHELDLKAIHYLKYALDKFDQYSKNTQVKSPSGYFKAILENTNNHNEFIPIYAKIEKSREVSRREKELQRTDAFERISTEETRKYRQAVINQFWSKLSEDEQGSIIAACKKYHGQGNLITKNTESEAFKRLLNTYITDVHDPTLINRKELERKIKQKQKAFDATNQGIF
ncbi:replication initiation protein [Algibacillus agarilyticus]|uniref:replication initiation protein n=1 Tax=Algibacillus agarilyticus TaxID=2234133 RepID=UPI000DD00652|nr:replication initiation protein [Algibacillus agarilyticus]